MIRSLVRVGCAAVIAGGLVPGMALSPRAAAASGFSVARFGGEHGHPTTTNATAIYYNPAGIAFSEGSHLFVDALVAWRRVTYTRDASDTPVPPGGEGANEGEASLFNILPSPAVGATTRVSDFAFGLGFFTPFGGQSSWSENERFENNQQFPGAVDGVQRWYSIVGVLRSSYGSLAAAWKIPDTGLAIGASMNLIVSQVDTLRARQPSGTDSLTSEGRSHLDVDGFDWSFGAGAMYEAIPDTLWIGASYQSKPNVSGGMVLEGRLENFFSGSSSDDEVELHQDLPDVVRLGATLSPVPGIELRLSGDYTRWSVFERQCLSLAGSPCEVTPDGLAAAGSTVLQNQPRDWHDTFGVRAGGSYWLNRELEFFGGLGFASNAVPDETLEPALPDWHGISLGLGGRLQVFDNVHVAASYTQIFYVPRDNRGESRLDQFQGPSRGPSAGGEYNQQLGFVDANVDIQF